jgi:hypothetical protein
MIGILMNSALARELKENSAYLRDSGFHSSARLMEIAANEIDLLTRKMEELERKEAKSTKLIPFNIGRLFRC